MNKSDGICKIDGVTMGEVSINALGHSVVLEAKYVLCNSETMERYGSGTRNTNWSEETIEKLRAFLGSMEADVCRDLFSEGATIGSVSDADVHNQDDVPGL